MGGELSGEETHSTCGDEDGDEAGESGGGGEAPPQVAACWGSMSTLKEPEGETKEEVRTLGPLPAGGHPTQPEGNICWHNAAVFTRKVY